MKKTIIILGVFALLLTSGGVYAAPEGRKGASDQAYEHANENAIFNRVTDWFATVGKSEGEKQKIMAERKAKRAAKRAEKEAQKAQKKAKEAKEGAEEEAKKAKAKAKKEVGVIQKMKGKKK